MPASIWLISRIEEISFNRASLLSRIVCTYSDCSSLIGPASPWESISEYPMIEVNGVRSSWLTVARKLDLRRSNSLRRAFIASNRRFWSSNSRFVSSVASMCSCEVR